MLSGNILSWTVCVESSCFLTPVGGSPSLPVLCFCSPSVSVVVSWHLYSSEGWGRAERSRARGWGVGGSPADLCNGSNSAAELSKWTKLFTPGAQCEKFGSRHYLQIITAYVHVCRVNTCWICSRSATHFWKEPKFWFLNAFFVSLFVWEPINHNLRFEVPTVLLHDVNKRWRKDV